MSTRTVTNNAPDPKAGLSLEDLSRFVADAYSAGLPGSSTVHVAIGWRGQIKQVSASGAPSDDLPSSTTPTPHPEDPS